MVRGIPEAAVDASGKLLCEVSVQVRMDRSSRPIEVNDDLACLSH
jgi:hypothetical protein